MMTFICCSRKKREKEVQKEEEEKKEKERGEREINDVISSLFFLVVKSNGRQVSNFH